ncbi:PREDICTED: uncharacterized protein LOC104789811 [Camelina sativa]|uniref:Uncharacterized protein LOC104789811 n=1 Tax=Camelina sativa TaxID=90675 RepID=A0ABM0ZCD9_CAMSA|nr:PREDICTED: uncharacterized protein LOC104789811 [Camelina sativa]
MDVASRVQRLLRSSWDERLNTLEALKSLQKTLKRWNRKVFGDIQKRKEGLMREIKLVQDSLDHTQSDDLLNKEEGLLKEFEAVLEQEETLWFQKSREKWIVDGDRNTTFFHTSTIIRRRRNKIEMLKDDTGCWILDAGELEKLALAYYQRLYSLEDLDAVVPALPMERFIPLSYDEKIRLNKPFTKEEVESAVRSMGSFKAPGPYGFQPEANDAIVVLIPNVGKPEKISQFCPISLCNVLFNTITKVMVARLKEVMMKLIGLEQTSFMSGHLITDNTVVCVTDPSMCLLWNGERTESFKPLRGLRQGDPLSPYLFMLCLERLCHLIDTSIREKKWKPIKLLVYGPRLSHICFADDLILFAETFLAQIKAYKGSSGEILCRLGSEERVSSKLSGWKGRSLSFDGRITLTKTVLSSIPVHTMSIIKLPQATLAKLDSMCKSFLWGSTADKKKQHLLAWDRVCLPKVGDGLGLNHAKEMNVALLAKIGWRLLHDNTSLWARVVRSKYKVGNIHDRSGMVAKGNWSSTWRSIGLGLREPLAEVSIRALSVEQQSLSVRDYWSDERGWDYTNLSPFLPEEVQLSLPLMVVDTVTGARDRLAWGDTTDVSEVGVWYTTFAIAVWWGWKWRCGNVFGDNRLCRDRIRFLKDLWKEVSAANMRRMAQRNVVERVERRISWVAPTVGWFKINTDGASHGNIGPATTGGVLRNFAGEWCGGFSLNIG